MAFENINIASLKQSINSCINSINYKSTTNIISSISNNNVWSTKSRNILKKSLETLSDVRYKELLAYLNKCLTIVGYIEQYKEEESKIRSYQSQISSLSSKLAALKSGCKIHTVCAGDTLWEISQQYGINMYAIADINGFSSINNTIYVGQTILIPRTSNVSNYSSQISNLRYKISQCRNTMDNLETKVANNI